MFGGGAYRDDRITLCKALNNIEIYTQNWVQAQGIIQARIVQYCALNRGNFSNTKRCYHTSIDTNLI